MYPNVKDESKVGSYDARAKAGGGYVWDDVLEYRVWCSPHNGAEDAADGSDYYYVFADCEEAIAYSISTKGADEPLALIYQYEYIEEAEDGVFVHIKADRIAEWPIEFLSRPRRSANTIPDFMSPNAPANKLDVIRGNG